MLIVIIAHLAQFLSEIAFCNGILHRADAVLCDNIAKFTDEDESNCSPTDSCQLRRWRACEAAQPAARDTRQQTAAIAPWIALSPGVAKEPMEKCGRLPVAQESRSLTGKTSPG
jgi:hypothetical protein